MKIIGDLLLTVYSDGRTSFGGPLLRKIKIKPPKHSPFIKEAPAPINQLSLEEEDAIRVWKVKERKARVEAVRAQKEMDQK